MAPPPPPPGPPLQPEAEPAAERVDNPPPFRPTLGGCTKAPWHQGGDVHTWEPGFQALAAALDRNRAAGVGSWITLTPSLALIEPRNESPTRAARRFYVTRFQIEPNRDRRERAAKVGRYSQRREGLRRLELHVFGFNVWRGTEVARDGTHGSGAKPSATSAPPRDATCRSAALSSTSTSWRCWTTCPAATTLRSRATCYWTCSGRRWPPPRGTTWGGYWTSRSGGGPRRTNNDTVGAWGPRPSCRPPTHPPGPKPAKRCACRLMVTRLLNLSNERV